MFSLQHPTHSRPAEVASSRGAIPIVCPKASQSERRKPKPTRPATTGSHRVDGPARPPHPLAQLRLAQLPPQKHPRSGSLVRNPTDALPLVDLRQRLWVPQTRCTNPAGARHTPGCSGCGRRELSRVRSSRTPKAYGRAENNSITPTKSGPRSSGMTTTERTPRRADPSISTRESNSTSSHHWVRRVLKQAPERPNSVSSRDPNSGAVGPLLARQTISPSRSKTTAAPVAPVARHACSTISLSTISSARSADNSGGNPPPLCAEKRAARSARLVSKLLSSGTTRSSPVADRRGFDDSGPDIECSGINDKPDNAMELALNGVSPARRGDVNAALVPFVLR